MTGSAYRRRRLATALSAVMIAQLLAVPAFAEVIKVQSSSYRDPATGYPCVTQTCDTLRLPGTQCICTKGNSITPDPNKVNLTCKIKQNRKWVACPVKSRY